MFNYVRTLRQLNHNVLLYLAATSLLGFAVDGGVFSVLFNLYLLRLGFGPELIGQIAAAGLLAYTLACLPAGNIGERFGHRNVLMVSLLMMCVGGALMPSAQLLPQPWIPAAIIAFYVLLYIGMALYYVNAVPYIMSITSDDERNRGFSMQTALSALAAFTGSLAGGFLPRLIAQWLAGEEQPAAAYGYPLMMASILLLISVWLLARIKRPVIESHSTPVTPQEDHTPVAVRRSRFGLYSPVVITILLLSIVRFFQVSGVSTTSTFFNVYMDKELAVATAQIGLVVASARLLGVFAALSTPVLVARWGAAPTVLLAAIINSISTLPLAMIPTPLAASIGFIGVASLSSMRYPAFMIFSTSKIPPKWRGTLAGVGEFSGGLSFAGLAFIGGWIAENQGFSTLFLLGGALTLTGTLLFYIWFILPRHKRIATPVVEVSSEPLL